MHKTAAHISHHEQQESRLFFFETISFLLGMHGSPYEDNDTGLGLEELNGEELLNYYA